MLPLAVQSGHEGYCRSHQLRSRACQEIPSHQERHHLVINLIPQWKHLKQFLSLQETGRYRKTLSGSWISLVTLQLPPWHFPAVWVHQKNCPAVVHSLSGRPFGRASWEKACNGLVSKCQKGSWRVGWFPIKVRCFISSLSRAPCIMGVEKQRAKQQRESHDDYGSREGTHGDSSEKATWVQAGVWSVTAGLPGRGCMFLEDPNHLRILEMLLMICPEAPANVFTELQFFYTDYTVKLK